MFFCGRAVTFPGAAFGGYVWQNFPTKSTTFGTHQCFHPGFDQVFFSHKKKTVE